MSGGRSGSMLSVGANSEDTPAVQERDEAQKSDTGQGKSDHNTVPACQKEESNRTEKPKQAGKGTPVVGLTSVRNTVRYPKRGGRSGSMLSVGANSEDPPARLKKFRKKDESNRTEKPKQAGNSTPVVGLASVRNTVCYPKRECQICGRSVIDSQVCFLCVF